MTHAELKAWVAGAGLRMKDFAALLGKDVTHVSTLGGRTPVQPHVHAMMKAWDLMLPSQREVWMDDCQARAAAIRDAKEAAE